MDPLISVIVPVYNVEQYLSRCIESLLNNTYQNLEIICIDDGSTDGSLETLRRYESADFRIIVIAKQNGGVASARNAGLKVSRGDFVAFVDSDDFVHPQFIERMLAAQRKTNADIVTGDYHSVREKELPVSFQMISSEKVDAIPLTRKAFFQKHLYRSYVWMKLFRRCVVTRVPFHEEIRYGEDAVFIAEIGESDKEITFCFLPEKLYYYVGREGSLVYEMDTQTRYTLAKLFAERALATSHDKEIYLEQAIRRLLSCRYITSSILLDSQIKKSCSSYLKECIQKARAEDIFSSKMMLAYQAFCYAPWTYWLYRSIKEPNMWKWERAQRRKRMEEKYTR